MNRSLDKIFTVLTVFICVSSIKCASIELKVHSDPIAGAKTNGILMNDTTNHGNDNLIRLQQPISTTFG